MRREPCHENSSRRLAMSDFLVCHSTRAVTLDRRGSRHGPGKLTPRIDHPRRCVDRSDARLTKPSPEEGAVELERLEAAALASRPANRRRHLHEKGLSAVGSVIDVNERGIGRTGRTSERDCGPHTPQPSSRFVGACTRLSENRLPTHWPTYMNQSAQIASTRDGETALAEVGFAVAVHCQPRAFICLECSYQFKHDVISRAVEMPDQLLRNVDFVVL
jgi:hypothetical protein